MRRPDWRQGSIKRGRAVPIQETARMVRGGLERVHDLVSHRGADSCHAPRLPVIYESRVGHRRCSSGFLRDKLSEFFDSQVSQKSGIRSEEF